METIGGQAAQNGCNDIKNRRAAALLPFLQGSFVDLQFARGSRLGKALGLAPSLEQRCKVTFWMGHRTKEFLPGSPRLGNESGKYPWPSPAAWQPLATSNLGALRPATGAPGCNHPGRPRKTRAAKTLRLADARPESWQQLSGAQRGADVLEGEETLLAAEQAVENQHKILGVFF